MRKRMIISALLILLIWACRAQERQKELRSVAFYNLENLFDTIHDTGKDDYEYLPNGDRSWDAKRYEAKLRNLARVLSELGRERVSEGPAVIGVAEVENHRVLNDLVNQPALLDKGYGIVHHEGPDKRGVDCALLYDPRQFTVTSEQLVISKPFQESLEHKTRGFLIVSGKLADEQVCFIVNHWPSRASDEAYRIHAARQVRALSDSLQRIDKEMKIIVMGDFNDDPMDKSLIALGAKKYRKGLKWYQFFNPWWIMLEDKGVGTLLYHERWNLFDQILLSSSLMKSKQGLQYHSHEVFMRQYLFEQSGRYKGSPLRTYGGKRWLNGYSDHLPTIVYLLSRV